LKVVLTVRWLTFLLVSYGLLFLSAVRAEGPKSTATASDLWVLKPVVRPEIPTELTKSPKPIDAFIAAEYKAKGLKPVRAADKSTLLRRVYLDVIGIPPTLAEQTAFLNDQSADAYGKVVDRLLASEQHGVRYARHWLDVLRYADADESMIAAPGIYLWRDWVIHALSNDLPYDQFVRTQLTGYRSSVRIETSPFGERARTTPRPEDMFALGFLARGAVPREGKDGQDLSMAAVETVSSAFMGLTVGCAKCHDHMYDPILQQDFYSMKALFDPLNVKKVMLATPAEVFAHGKAVEGLEKKRAAVEGPINELIAPYKKKLYEERVEILPSSVRAVIRKPERERTAQEQKIADDYFPVLRIDPAKLLEVMPAAEQKKYKDLQQQLTQVNASLSDSALPAFWTVDVDPKKALEKTYILTSGDPQRPELNHEVQPGWPFAPAKIDFPEGRIEAFSDWLTTPHNPLFARVAVNRLWQWHFGEGLQKTPSDFGKLGGSPSNPPLLDWLAAEFVKQNFSMKAMHRLILTSDTYKLASEADPELDSSNLKADPNNTFLWHFRLQRLDAEPIWDSILAIAGNLDLSVGGPSFDIRSAERKQANSPQKPPVTAVHHNRRAAYMIRGYSTNHEVMPHFLQAFDVDDGRFSCPLRTQTVTAPQALFMMNSDEIDKASVQFAERLRKDAGGDLRAAVDLAYRIALVRPPSATETARAVSFLENDPARLKNFAWLLFNLDEFVYAR
jgi:hypothetical protein